MLFHENAFWPTSISSPIIIDFHVFFLLMSYKKGIPPCNPKVKGGITLLKHFKIGVNTTGEARFAISHNFYMPYDI